MPRNKLSETWQKASRLAWLRYSAQCRYRNEEYIDWPTWQELWNSQSLWLRKGRGNENLVISKIDFTQPASRYNVCICERIHTLRARRYYHFFDGDHRLDDSVIIRKLT